MFILQIYFEKKFYDGFIWTNDIASSGIAMECINVQKTVQYRGFKDAVYEIQ
jgi:hypothetical protein